MQPEVRHSLGQISEAVEVTAVTRAEDSPLVDMNDFQDSESFGPRNRIREIRTFGSVGDWFKRLAGLPDNACCDALRRQRGHKQGAAPSLPAPERRRSTEIALEYQVILSLVARLRPRIPSCRLCRRPGIRRQSRQAIGSEGAPRYQKINNSAMRHDTRSYQARGSNCASFSISAVSPFWAMMKKPLR
jgi:hypothetical protein